MELNRKRDEMNTKSGAYIGNWIRVLALTATIGLVGYTTGVFLHQVLVNTKHAYATTDTACENNICAWDCTIDEDDNVNCDGHVCAYLTDSNEDCIATGDKECIADECSTPWWCVWC